MSAVIETNHLTKVYEGAARGQDVHALNDLSVAVQEREIFGYLGPNGSGKTTTIKMLFGLIFPTSGTIKIMGSDDIDSPDIKRKIGYLPEGAYSRTSSVAKKSSAFTATCTACAENPRAPDRRDPRNSRDGACP